MKGSCWWWLSWKREVWALNSASKQEDYLDFSLPPISFSSKSNTPKPQLLFITPPSCSNNLAVDLLNESANRSISWAEKKDSAFHPPRIFFFTEKRILHFKKKKSNLHDPVLFLSRFLWCHSKKLKSKNSDTFGHKPSSPWCNFSRLLSLFPCHPCMLRQKAPFSHTHKKKSQTIVLRILQPKPICTNAGLQQLI